MGASCGFCGGLPIVAAADGPSGPVAVCAPCAADIAGAAVSAATDRAAGHDATGPTPPWPLLSAAREDAPDGPAAAFLFAWQEAEDDPREDRSLFAAFRAVDVAGRREGGVVAPPSVDGWSGPSRAVYDRDVAELDAPCHLCGEPAVWAVPWGDAFCALHGAGRPDVRWRGGGLTLRETVEAHPYVVAAGWSWPDRDVCPACGEGPQGAGDPCPGAVPLLPFTDACEYPLLWADDADVVSCVCCDTYFVRRAGRLFLTHQV